ncbi:uncharacterized protein LOC130747308 [Lotus japonicus]|uniref:uncharacterized protein LOC130747308 n=1 Tax=Lotus japonicus TaxID=34305 RepID=UPI00258BF35E|nr:uncharacterized protein LOC130747308 [Lotus japonicus]
MEQEEQELRKKIEEAEEELKKVREECRMKMSRNRMFKYMAAGKITEDLGIDEIQGLHHVIDLDMKKVNDRIQELKKAKVTEEEKGKKPLDDGNLKKI